MFKFIKLLRSVDDIKVGNCISLFIRHCKIVYFIQFVKVVFVSYIMFLHSFCMNSFICVYQKYHGSKSL